MLKINVLKNEVIQLYRIQKKFYNNITQPAKRFYKKNKVYQKQKKIYRDATKPILKKYKQLISIDKTAIVEHKKELESFNKQLLSSKKIKQVCLGEFYNCCIASIKQYSKKIKVVSPSIEINKYANVHAYGRSSFILNKSRKILYIDNCIKKKSLILRNKEKKVIISRKKIELDLVNKKRKFSKGILLCGLCSGNYAHWVTELLPKICYADIDLRYKDYPLVIDNWNHRIFDESAKFVSKYNRKIIKINEREVVLFKELVDISPTSYIPIQPPKYFGKLSAYQFSIDALQKLRLCTQAKIRDTKKENCIRKIFLKRKNINTGNQRFLINSEEIEFIAEKFGYSVIDPADLTFDNQVKLFSEATHIISPIGASLANLVFSNNKCNTLILSPQYEKCDFSFFSSLLGVLGHNYRYLLGTQIYDEKTPIENRSYFISDKKFIEVMNEINK